MRTGYEDSILLTSNARISGSVVAARIRVLNPWIRRDRKVSSGSQLVVVLKFPVGM
jgi:hypothetical protein